ncbi:hypothetical protein [Bosea sp. BIWAKO-01]|uniref:hypothetical protein n=1 Tax=Bosea sp. BIWAKO-01 TaxID=506668 RepID=UPI000853B65B|nr:hypothetical protein [Bosea sp. BIWAKO-01]GAU85978.1 hypothetical protein BIWAKO_05926 [Bosea sp. BIWAKO-01]
MKGVLATVVRWAAIAALKLAIALVLLTTVGGWWGIVIIIAIATILYLTVDPRRPQRDGLKF